MELSIRYHTALAFLVGFWSLAAQFIFNRIIFFYVANSEFAAASIISIHLAGFLIGSLLIRRFSISVNNLIFTVFVLTVFSFFLIWHAGAPELGLSITAALAVLFGLLLASCSGALVIQLISESSAPDNSRGIIISDSAGSVVGAIIAGFFLIPYLGITTSFLTVIAIQYLALAIYFFTEQDKYHFKKIFLHLTSFFLLGIVFLTGFKKDPAQIQLANRLITDVIGQPISEERNIIFAENSPYGLVSVSKKREDLHLWFDNRAACSYWEGKLKENSQYLIGYTPAKIIADRPNVLVANIGLGCGLSLSGILEVLKPSAVVDVIEINPKVPEAQKKFWASLPYNYSDSRVTMHIADGFRYFSELNSNISYDAIVIDMSWMHNMNATHLFSLEMYKNVQKNLKTDGILSVWIEEGNPFSKLSLITYKTLKTVFPNVYIDISNGTVVFYASVDRADIINYLTPMADYLSEWVKTVSDDTPINRLDNLVMNQYKFTLFGDSTWERLFSKYQMPGQEEK